MSWRDRLANTYNNVADAFNAQYGYGYGQQPQSPASGAENFGYPSRQQYPLDLWASVTLDANGNGVAQLGPARVKEWWTLQSCWVGVSGFTLSDPNASAQLFIGPNVLSNYQAANTVNGSVGDSCALGGRQIGPGYQIFVQWSGGKPGATAQMHLLGIYQIGAPGSV